MEQGPTFVDTAPLPPSSKEVLEDMRKAKEEKGRKKVFFHYSRDGRAELCTPLENYSVRTITYVRDLDEGVYKLVEVIQDWKNKVLKLEDKKGVLHYVEDGFNDLKQVRPQSLIYLKKDSDSLIVKDSGGYYTLRKR